ncbi:MAG TPA: NUDIX domain-containing protein [Gaiellaceae bacterium]|nr:NUDIX domain-containing protein [Gaiellaceae bacterium]
MRGTGSADAKLRAALLVERPPRGLPPPLSVVPDVLAPGLDALFCGINPGRASAAAGAHFANPRNDFWRLLHEAGFTPTVLAPEEQFRLLDYGYGLTNAARRTTRGSSELRRGDFEGTAERLARLAEELTPLVVAFVGKAAYQGAYRERPQLGLQERRLGDTLLFVLPSTSPANAAVPWGERLRWFGALHELLHPPVRRSPRAIVLDDDDRVLLYRFVSPGGLSFWGTPGGGLEPGESWDDGMRRELLEEIGLEDAELGPVLWTRERRFVWHRVVNQLERYYLVRVSPEELTPERAVETEEGMHEHRWWTVAELAASSVERWPAQLADLLEDLLEHGPPATPVDLSSRS